MSTQEDPALRAELKAALNGYDPTRRPPAVPLEAPPPVARIDEEDPVTAAIHFATTESYERLKALVEVKSDGQLHSNAAPLVAAAHLGSHLEALRQTLLLVAQPKPMQAMTRGEREHVQMVEEVLGVTQAQLSREHAVLIECLTTLESLAAALTSDSETQGPLPRDLTDDLAKRCATLARRGRSLVAPVTDLVEGA